MPLTNLFKDAYGSLSNIPTRIPYISLKSFPRERMLRPAEAALARAKLSLHPDEFLLIRLPPSAVVAAAGVVAELADPFIALILDARELTCILDRESYDEYAHRLLKAEVSDVSYRLITFEESLDHQLVSLAALAAHVLANAGIPLLALSGYAYDHILIPSHKADAALAAISDFQASLRDSQ